MEQSEKIRALMPNFGTFYATWCNRLMENCCTQPMGLEVLRFLDKRQGPNNA